MTGDALLAVSAAGLLFLAYAVGCATPVRQAYALRDLPLGRVALCLVVGAALMTPILVVIAAVGWFRIQWIGVIAWLLASVIVARRVRLRRPSAPGAIEVIVALSIAVFAATAWHGRDETLGAGRDQQVYAEFAVALARNGTPAISYPVTDSADRALLREQSTRAACHAGFFDRWSRARIATTPFVLPGGTNACNGIDDPIVLLHPWGWVVWLAVAYQMGGLDGIYSANIVVFALGAMLFFAMARMFVGAVGALAATVMLLLIPSSLWIAGISLSEPLCMTLLFAVPLLVGARCTHRVPLVAGVTLAAILVRIDAVLIVPISIAAALCSTFANPLGIRARTHFVAGQLGALFGATVIYVVLLPSYLDALFPEFASVVAVSLLLAGATLAMTPDGLRRLGSVVRSRSTRGALIAVLLVLFAYGAAIRPMLAPAHPGIRSVAKVYDLREYAIFNLAAYVSWPVLIAALTGLCLAIASQWGSRSRMQYPLVLMLALGPSTLFLALPSVSPDQPWGFRRFVPEVVPYTLLFAVVFVRELIRRPGSRVARGVSLAASGAMIASVAILPSRIALFSENSGLATQLDSIAQALPSSLTVASGRLQNVAAALLVAYDKPVAIASNELATAGDERPFGAWIRTKVAEGQSPWILHDSEFDDVGLSLSPRRAWTIRREFVAPALRAPAHRVETTMERVTLSRVNGFDAGYAKRMFGARRAWGSDEGGFFATQSANFGTFRYTNGNAWIVVPTSDLRDCVALKVDLFTYARRMVHRRVSILLDGKIAWTGMVPTGVSTIRVPIDMDTAHPKVRIGLVSDSVEPGDMGPSDPRVGLSEALIGIRALHKGEPAEAGPGMAGFRAEVSVAGTLQIPVRVQDASATSLPIDVANVGSAYWPSFRDHPNPVGVVKFALDWSRHGTPAATVGNNRWPLWISMLPGDRNRILVPIDPQSSKGKRLPPGLYDLTIRMVREGVAMFPEAQSPPLTVLVRVAPSTGPDRAS